jgi:hypothetical protein
MIKETYFARIDLIVILIIPIGLLFGCAGRMSEQEEHTIEERRTISEIISTPSEYPSPDGQISPTRTPDLYQPEDVRGTFNAQPTQNINQITSDQRSSTTPTLSPKELCSPFPDHIQYLGSTKILGYPAWTLRAHCKSETTHLRSPVGDMTLFDYTTLTGRFAYGPPDSDQRGLWVYDYWIGFSEKWSDEKVIKAEWSPIRNADEVQLLAILDTHGTLSLSAEPFKADSIAQDVTHFSISPKGDKLVYVKSDVVYVIPIRGGQPRKLAEEAYGTPRWALAQNAIIIPSSPLKIASLDGSGSFIPLLTSWIKKRVGYLCDGMGNCAYSSRTKVNQILWDEQSRLLVFQIEQPSEKEKFRALFVFELSEDLRSIVNLQTIYGDFKHKPQWDIQSESVIHSDGNVVRIGVPSQTFSSEARILSVDEQDLMVEFVRSPGRSSTLAQHLCHVTVSDQTLIIDIDGYPNVEGILRPGMIIELNTRKLSPYTLSLFAYTIQITCDQDPCYLGIEGRS